MLIKALSKVIIPIVAAIIGAAAAIIGAFIAYREFNYFMIDIRVYNEDGAPMEAQAQVSDDSQHTAMNRRTNREGRLELNKLRNGQYRVLVSAAGYDPVSREFDQHDKQLDITLKKTAAISGPPPFNLTGWSVWGGISVKSEGNVITVNGEAQVAGYVNDRINEGIAGKKLILEIKNSGASKYSNSRMFKMTVTRDDRLLKPLNIPSLANGEYLPAQDGRVEFILPVDFDGKLGFVFYEAELHGLMITAFYE
jgi:hypothetical protein